ncbi:MAG: T9SS type A sorting domain-containing protein [Bacteroidetes bacterium]|nr:T9SS type A sorting domain-containing protein [Bacteroidota bacterium]
MKKIFFLIITVPVFIAVIYFFKSGKFTGNDSIEKVTSEKEKNFVPAEDWFERQRAFPFDEIPQDEYLKSIEYVKKFMTPESPDNSSGWSQAGPFNIEGRITTVAVHPFNPLIVYAGTANGGLWKSTDFCQSWFSIFDGQNTSSIGAVAVDPVNPEIIYCGTGESNALRSYYPGTGIYRSVNGGDSWSFIGLDSSFCIGNIAVNPVNTQEIYVAAGGWTRRKNDQRGIYKTTNSGLNWQRSLFLSDSVGAVDVAVSPSDPAKVYAAMWERQRREDYIKYGGRYSGMYVTSNSGLNWQQVQNGFPFNDVNLGRISFDISASDPDIIYALTANTSGSTRGLYKTSNGGNSWSLINSSVAASSSYAWFNRICRIDPSDPDKLFCGGLSMELSNDGGTSFSVPVFSHVDQHAVSFAKSNPSYIVIGNDGGIDYSTNGGITWGESTSLPITQFYAGEIDYNNPSVILGGAQDNGTIRSTSNFGTWSEIYGGDGFYCLVDYSNSLNVYASSQSGGLGRSTDGGSSFQYGANGLDIQYTNWMTPYVMDKNNPQTLFCGTYKIFKTTNGMQSWTAISPDLSNGHVRNLGTITTVDVAKSDANVIYCGTDDANVWRTTNSGGVWTKINSGLPYRWVTRVAVHPDSANVCYVTLSGYKVDSTGAHVFRTANYGDTWTSVSGNLPDAPVNDIIIDPDNTNTLYIATDITVMYSTDLGINWNILSSGIPSNVPCHDLTFHEPTRTLVVWTHGRSAYKISLPVTKIIQTSSAIPSDFKLEQNYPNPFNPSTRIIYNIAENSEVQLEVYNVLGKKVSELVNEKQSAGTYSVNFNGINFPGGIYFYKLISVSEKNRSALISETKKMMLIK